jgi:hypothetical protein
MLSTSTNHFLTPAWLCFALVCEEILGVRFPIPQSGLVSIPVWLVVDYGACEHVSQAHPTRIQ